ARLPRYPALSLWLGGADLSPATVREAESTMTDWELYHWAVNDAQAASLPMVTGARFEAVPAEADALAQEAVAEASVQVDTRLAFGLAMSFGVVSWAARGSMLLASVLVSSPAWRSFDLLPVLRRRRDEEDDDDDNENDEAESADAGSGTAARRLRASRRDDPTLELK
ncbi:MAG TPA: hypothetical protein VLA16_16115, partial [Ideonella sp.]|nr:hypothetical protein [Ideonella sp.]